MALDTPTSPAGSVGPWLDEHRLRSTMRVRTVPLAELTDWSADPVSGDITHRSGRFFRIEGLDVHMPTAPIARWQQPVINQPEVGVLGFLLREFDGVLHCLVQAKAEPGNPDLVQISPTVQATRSNYTRVHNGRHVPYLEHFQDRRDHRVHADVRQSEQGSRFLRKRNRNMVVETTSEIPVLDGFRWLTLGQVYRLTATDNVLNMDARSVLACLPIEVPELPARTDDVFQRALHHSYEPGIAGGVDEVLHWLTEVRTTTEVWTERVAVRALRDWTSSPRRISHRTGGFFEVVGMRVSAACREVEEWAQPVVRPRGVGVVAFLVARIGGVLHALVQAVAEPGYVDVAELGPTVQCTPGTYDELSAAVRPPLLETVLRADPGQVRFDSILSEEGGRFYHARNRYLVVEVNPGSIPDLPSHRWMTVRQLTDLVRHSHYLNVEARSLVTCLHGLAAGT
ncbi:NDP-hexose 2,3-dehydratase family protein [Saccharopolyspora sp. CA-218241]|uniref:NDP-hexose 2,3-dehydratase family protein n=1 Tax=Saccharopolyspora sp. CA-218241 TaxID=3240027 RepID=UPI003D9A074C